MHHQPERAGQDQANAGHLKHDQGHEQARQRLYRVVMIPPAGFRVPQGRLPGRGAGRRISHPAADGRRARHLLGAVRSAAARTSCIGSRCTKPVKLARPRSSGRGTTARLPARGLVVRPGSCRSRTYAPSRQAAWWNYRHSTSSRARPGQIVKVANVDGTR